MSIHRGKNLFVLITLICLCMASIAVPTAYGEDAEATLEEQASYPFADVTKSTDHADDIVWLANSGISTGYQQPHGKPLFKPMAPVYRQDMAAFLFRIAVRSGLVSSTWQPTSAQRRAFSDVTSKTEHAREIWWLASTGISTGYPDGTFRPMAPVYRQDMAAFLYRFATKEGRAKATWKAFDVERKAFSDVTSKTDHSSDIWWLASAKISTGYPNGTFRGMTCVYRQDMAAFLHRLDQLASDLHVVYTNNTNEYASATAELVKQGVKPSEDAQAKDPYFSRRLIVKDDGTAIDFSAYGATLVVDDAARVSLVQFASNKAAKSAAAKIKKLNHVLWAEADGVVSILEDSDLQDGVAASQDEGDTALEEEELTSDGVVSEQEPSQTEEDGAFGSDGADALDRADEAISQQEEVIEGVDEAVEDQGAVLEEQEAFEQPTVTLAEMANSWGVAKIGADRLAASLSHRIDGVTVAVIDSGVDAGHPYLRDRVVNGGYDFIDNDSNPNDEHKHGTAMAGIIVDCTPGLNIRILPERVMGSDGTGFLSVAAAGIRHSVDAGAEVINVSLGGQETQALHDAIDYARGKNAVVIVAAGNSGGSNSTICPSHLSQPIVVGAVNSRNQRWSSSSYGSSVDLVAPGVDVTYTVPGGGTESYSGTSLAAPHISAASAMVKMLYPSYTPAQVELMLTSCATDLGSKGKDAYYGYGIPDLSKLVKKRPRYDLGTRVTLTGILCRESYTYKGGTNTRLVLVLDDPIDARYYTYPNEGSSAWHENVTSVDVSALLGTNYSASYVGRRITVSGSIGGSSKQSGSHYENGKFVINGGCCIINATKVS